MPDVFPTKVDAWLAAVLGGSFVLAVGSAVPVVATATDPSVALIAIVPLVLSFGLVALLALPTRYELHERELVVRSGVIRYRAPYLDIRGVEPTRTIFSAPAWSLDRLAVSYGTGLDLVISPRDKAGFLNALHKRVPHLRLEGDRLVAAR